MMRWHLLLPLFWCLFGGASAWAQLNAQLGSLNVQNYLPKTYGANAQIFDICQDHRGVMFFGNQQGVVEYDGYSWRTIKVGNDAEVNAIETDPRGRVWVGAINELGYLKPNALGELRFESIRHLLPEGIGDFGKITQIKIDANGQIYFQCDAHIFIFFQDQFDVITTADEEENFHLSYLVDNTFYVRVSNKGLFSLKKGTHELQPVGNGVIFSNKSIFDLTRFNGQLMAVTDKDGIYMFSPTMEAKKINVLDGINVYSGQNIRDEYYAAGTFSNGVIVLNKHFQPLYHIDINSGMADGKVNCIFLDREDNLWVGTNKGISKIEIMSPVSIYGQNNGILSGIEAITTHKGMIFMAAADGVYYLDLKQASGSMAQKVPNLNVDCYGLLSFETEADSILLIGAVDGINAFEFGKPIYTIAYGEPYRMLRSVKDPNRVMICHTNGLSSIYWNGKSFKNEGYVSVLREHIFNMMLAPNGTLWLGTIDNGLFQTTEDIFDDSTTTVIHYNQDDGLPSGPLFIGLIENEPFLATDKGVFVKTERGFERTNELGVDFTSGKLAAHRINVDKEGKVWMVLIDKLNNYDIGFSERKNGHAYEWRSREFSRFADEIVHAIHHGKDGITWLGGLKGLLRYDNNKKVNYNQPFNALIRYVGHGGDPLFLGSYLDDEGLPGLEQANEFVNDLDYSSKNLVFRFSATTFVDESKTLFSYMLEGQDETWSEWSSATQAIYTNVDEGEYEFKVKARNIYGQESEVASYRITIKPPWYRTVWAYLAYGVVFVLLIYSAIRFSIRRVKKQKEYLEGVVKERTAEVVAQKEEIEKQKVIVEEKNKDIMDSIKYAKRIQDAILPHDDILRRAFLDAFVLFRPKDIVSGDFYWIKQKESRSLFAAVDCTGHGVPGAFVSIIGNNGLNRALNEFNLINPSDILDKLTQIVEEAFVQEGYDVKDGMDIALCSLDRENMIVEYAGANNPFYLIRQGELTEIKADKQPIGQFEGRKPFTNHKISVQEGDCIFVFSDGYADQFGGPRGKKFKYSTFKKTLLELSEKPMPEIREELKQIFADWSGNHEQIDDVCVIGVRV